MMRESAAPSGAGCRLRHSTTGFVRLRRTSPVATTRGPVGAERADDPEGVRGCSQGCSAATTPGPVGAELPGQLASAKIMHAKTALQRQIDTTDRQIDTTDRQIDATDRQIDQLGYERYGLTDDEIRIVEEATQ